MSHEAYDRVRASFNAEAERTYAPASFTKSGASVELMRQAFQIVRQELGSIRTARIVEAGCGNGYWLAQIPAWPEWNELDLELIGFDLSDELVRLAKQRPPAGSVRFHFEVDNLCTYRAPAPAD